MDKPSETTPEVLAPDEAERRQRKVLRRRLTSEVAPAQGGVVSRGQLYAHGFTRAEVRAQVRAERWQLIGRHCLGMHNGPLTTEARHWVAALEAGPRAFIDGESALVLAGLENYTPARIRVSVPRGAKIRHRPSTVDIRQTRRWAREDMEETGLPRSRVPVAAVRAALWAKSDRQAALLLTMTVQQGLAKVEALAAEMLRVRRHKRRAFLHDVLLDLAGGVRSLGELDVIRGCRERGLPEPDCQVWRKAPHGSYYLDLRWNRWKLVVEVEGIHHIWAQEIVKDAIRQNTIALDGDTVLRIPLLGLRLCPDEFFAQIEAGLHAAGCPAPDRLAS